MKEIVKARMFIGARIRQKLEGLRNTKEIIMSEPRNIMRLITGVLLLPLLVMMLWLMTPPPAMAGTISGGFTTLTASPMNITCFTVDPTTGLMYGQGDQSSTNYYSYNPATNTWSTLASCPVSSGNNGGATYMDGKIYNSYCSNTNMRVYDIVSNTWSTIAGGLQSGNIANDGTDIYVSANNSFKKWDISASQWVSLTATTTQAWGGLQYKNGYFYSHAGNGSTPFKRYSVATDTWENLTAVPGGAVLGSAIFDAYYYCMGSYGGTNLYSYDLGATEWNNTLTLPFTINDTSIVVYNNSLYIVQGEAGTGFTKFTPNNPILSNIEGTSIAYTIGDGAVVITSTIVGADNDDTNFESGTVSITGNFETGNDVLAFVDQNGISGIWNSTTGVLTLTGSATIANWNTALRSVTYSNNSLASTENTRTVSFQVRDGEQNSNVQTRSIVVTVAPAVTLTSTATSPTNTSPIPMTVTFSKAVTGFAIGDITVGGGAADNFVAVSGTVYTFDVTPSGQGAVTVDVAAGVAQDAALNNNTAATQFSITYDSVAPTVTLTSTATSPTKVSPIPMTATFSEAVTGFVIDDITVGNGTASNFVAVSGTVYTFDVTPSGQGAVTVDIAAGVAQDATLNNNTAATQFSITYDSVAPTVTLTSTDSSPTKTSPIPMTATFSKAVTGFAIGDITVSGGAAGNFAAVSGTVYTFDVTPSGQGAVTLDVAADVAQDAALNPNTAATQFSITYDSVAPTVTLTSTATSPTNTSPIPMTATFSEAVTGFVVGDITVGNGTASNFVAVSATVYTFDVTPSGQDAVTVDVAAGVAQDATLNNNTTATQFSITYDSISPTVTLTSTASSPTNTSPIPMTATFSKAVTGFVVGDITVGNGTASNFVAVSATVYTFDVTPSGQGAVTVDVAAGVAQDAALNPNTAATQFSITYDSGAPTITSFTATSTDEGDVVIITGTDFTGATAVKFGDTDALSFTVDSDTQITALVAPGTSGKITVTTDGGTAIYADDYTSPASPARPVNWWVIGSIIGGVILIGAIAWWLMVLRPRRAG